MKVTRITTHPRTFHADDAFAVVVLTALYPRATVMRKSPEADFVQTKRPDEVFVDVGGYYLPEQGCFDHHQRGFSETHALPGHWPMAAFGLIWRHYGVEFCGGDMEVAVWMEEHLVCWIDALDNGDDVVKSEVPTLSDLIDDFNFWPVAVQNLLDFRPVTMQDLRFAKALKFAREVLAMRLHKARLEVEALRQVRKRMEQTPGKILILEEECTWFDAVLRLNEKRTEPILFVVYLRADKTWCCQAVSTQLKPFEPMKPFPELWRGLSDKALQQASKISDAIFCHRAGHLLITQSKESALNAANQNT
jgi:uncharacterized UPF0160 family protein